MKKLWFLFRFMLAFLVVQVLSSCLTPCEPYYTIEYLGEKVYLGYFFERTPLTDTIYDTIVQLHIDIPIDSMKVVPIVSASALISAAYATPACNAEFNIVSDSIIDFDIYTINDLDTLNAGESVLPQSGIDLINRKRFARRLNHSPIYNISIGRKVKYPRTRDHNTISLELGAWVAFKSGKTLFTKTSLLYWAG